MTPAAPAQNEPPDGPPALAAGLAVTRFAPAERGGRAVRVEVVLELAPVTR